MFTHSRRRIALGGTIAALAAGALAGPAMAAPGSSGDTPAGDMRKSGGDASIIAVLRKAGGDQGDIIAILTPRKAGGRDPEFVSPVSGDPGPGGGASRSIIAI